MWMVQALIWKRNVLECWKKQLYKKRFGLKGSKYEAMFQIFLFFFFLLCRIFIGGMGNLIAWDIFLAQMKQLGPHQRAECAILLYTCFRYLAKSHCLSMNVSPGAFGYSIFSSVKQFGGLFTSDKIFSKSSSKQRTQFWLNCKWLVFPLSHPDKGMRWSMSVCYPFL